MNLKIKTIRFENYCGYKEGEISFVKKDGSINNLALFFGPNGIGKSSALNAIRFLSSPYENIARNVELALRKLTYHPDYEADYEGFKPNENKLVMEGIFDSPEGDKRVLVTSKGIEVCEIPRKLHGHAYYIDADHPSNMRRFQIDSKYLDYFIDICEIVYGYKCEVGRKIDTMPDGTKMLDEDGKPCAVYTDFIIHKLHRKLGNTTKVHFKTMSDGEKKIATLFSYLFDPCYIDARDIILVDNVEMHVYFKRHSAMIDRLVDILPNKQFLLTSHSGTLINHVSAKYGSEHLYDLEELKDGVISLNEWSY